ncbi:MAG TPA: hypothetical protein VFD36_23050 [Kofleriaceae bacterium]|nr:hypothetical protein [Kofleriaceae bacterium]
MRQFLDESAEQQARILTTLGGRLERGAAAAKPDATDPPSREWVRAASLYFDGHRHVAATELDRAKLELDRVRVRLLARRAGMQELSEDEYAAQLIALGRESVAALSDDEIAAEVQRRGLALAAGQG